MGQITKTALQVKAYSTFDPIRRALLRAEPDEKKLAGGFR